MVEPWFDVNTFGAWFGTIVGGGGGTLGGLLGALIGTLAPKGKARLFIISSMLFFAGLGVVLLLIGLYALISSQPYGIWYPFVISGAVFSIVFVVLIPIVNNRYRQAEERKITAESIRNS